MQIPVATQTHRFAHITCVLALTAIAQHTLAVPYASGVDRVGDTVNFTLNEPADTVTITRDSGNAIVLNTAPSGSHAFDMTGFSDYTISVTHSAPVGWAESVNSIGNPMLGFERANGVAVNQNPGSPNFGRFYVSQRDGTASAAGRQMGDGIYVFNADATDAFGITDPNDASAARTAGLDFSGSDSSPFRLSVGPDDTLYVSDASDTHGGIYHTDADVTTGGNLLAGLGGVQPIVGQNHGSIISTPLVSGSLAAGDLVLYTIDQDLPGSVADTGSHVWRYDIGDTSSYSGAGTLVLDASTMGTISDGTEILSDANANIDMDITRDPHTGNFIISQDSYGLLIMDPTLSTVLFNSRQFEIDHVSTTNFRYTIASDVSPDGRFLAVRASFDLVFNSPVRLYMLNEDGLPIDDTGEAYSYVGGFLAPPVYAGAPRAPIEYDLAGNIYTAGNSFAGGERLGIYGPGGDSAAITRSDGTFTINGTTYGDGYLAGDLNGDGFVGIEDLSIVLGNWNQTVAHGVLTLGDPTGDGFVGIEDLNSVLSNWNAGTPPDIQADIPEPGALVLLGLSGLVMINKRVR